MTITLQTWGNSHGVRLPKILLDALGWVNGEALEVEQAPDSVILRKANKRKTIAELFANYEGDYSPEEVDWGEPVGCEVW